MSTYSDNMPTLGAVLDNLNDPPSNILPLPLPIAHLTRARSFKEIAKCFSLEPQDCEIFNSRILYFSYGRIFHRHGGKPITDVNEAPVAFLFKSNLISRVDCFFPYDTGAAAKGIYGDLNKDELSQFTKYRVPNKQGTYRVPSKLIYHVYQSNENYLLGQVSPHIDFQSLDESWLISHEPLITLLKFLQSDLSDYGVDGRQRSIECQIFEPISLRDVLHDIIWMCFPENYEKEYHKICFSCEPPHPIETSTYPYWHASRPNEIASQLEYEANKFVEKYLKLKPGV